MGMDRTWYGHWVRTWEPNIPEMLAVEGIYGLVQYFEQHLWAFGVLCVPGDDSLFLTQRWLAEIPAQTVQKSFQMAGVRQMLIMFEDWIKDNGYALEDEIKE